MENFDLKKYLAEGKLLKEFLPSEQEIEVYDPESSRKKWVNWESFKNTNFIEEDESTIKFQISKFPHITPEGNTFDLSFIGFRFKDAPTDQKYLRFNFGYIEIFYEGEKLEEINGSRSAGVQLLITETVNKTKKWLDKNASTLISGNTKYRQFST
ncbi:hypothetical protein OAD97_00660 [bacterium]|nr:hypothetical protein [bacterium]|tara:strand:+ start:246 stop:710 length:465 start_codon:yes stop_codon:yes gene_type:complete